MRLVWGANRSLRQHEDASRSRPTESITKQQSKLHDDDWHIFSFCKIQKLVDEINWTKSYKDTVRWWRPKVWIVLWNPSVGGRCIIGRWRSCIPAWVGCCVGWRGLQIKKCHNVDELNHKIMSQLTIPPPFRCANEAARNSAWPKSMQPPDLNDNLILTSPVKFPFCCARILPRI